MKQRTMATRMMLASLLSLGLLTTVLSPSVSAGVESTSVVGEGAIPSGVTSRYSAPSMKLDADGNPTIAYFDLRTGSIKVVRCDDPGCRGVGDTVSAPVTNLAESDVRLSLRLDSVGNPVIAYFDSLGIHVLRCMDGGCTTGGTNQIVDDDASIVGFPGLDLTSQDHPVVAYWGSGGELRVVTCTDPACGSQVGPVAPRPGEQLGSTPSVVVGPDDRTNIAYGVSISDPEIKSLRLVRCASVSCDGTVETVKDLRWFTDPVLQIEPVDDGSYNLVVGSIVNRPVTGLVILGCNSESCLELVDRPTGELAVQSSLREPFVPDLALTSDGPVLTFLDINETGSVLVASFDPVTGEASVMSPDPTTTGFTHPHAIFPDLEIDSSGSATIAYVTDKGLVVTRCNDRGCVPTCSGLPVTIDLGAGGSFAEPGPDDVVRGTDGDDEITSGRVICGQGGDDTITAAAGSSVFAGAGDDVIEVTGDGSLVSGGPGNDQIIGGIGEDRLLGGAGNDLIDGRGGADWISGGEGRDRLFGRRGNDVIIGSAGVDRLSGGPGNDTLSGGSGNDLLFGNLGRDALRGGSGDDILKGGGWIDTLDGGVGQNDRCSTIVGESRVRCERGVFGL